MNLPPSTSTKQAVELVRQLVVDRLIDGILVQHPMPPHIDERAVFEAISVDKDVDGVTAGSFLSMANGVAAGFGSCTPEAIMALLDAYQVPIAGWHAVVFGRSAILGKPAALLLFGRDGHDLPLQDPRSGAAARGRRHRRRRCGTSRIDSRGVDQAGRSGDRRRLQPRQRR
jgi:5,10-methylene-tetrahydrofolate dehydrogenase/methenyl tetrahydrofolate cyclohydrolase